MWRPTMSLMCLIAALSGTPLRQAEAVHDFSHAIADVGVGDVVDEPDGGVGDDAGDAILAAGNDERSPRTTVTPAVAEGISPRHLPSARSFVDYDRRPPGGTGSPISGSERRYAWLRCFLF